MDPRFVYDRDVWELPPGDYIWYSPWWIKAADRWTLRRKLFWTIRYYQNHPTGWFPPMLTYAVYQGA